ncbi:MAG: response regulator transcription factor [Phycisphaerae bacterium]|nr:response regulator transcription factor [Phycisphaerae bacterium]
MLEDKLSTNIRVLIVDDHALVREALSERLQREPGITVVGTAGTADEAIEKANACNPNVILMDIDMPGLICFDAAKTIASLRPDAHIIFLSAFTHDGYIEQALEVEARGYLTKREPPDRVVEAIREVASGGAYFSNEVRSRIVVHPRGAKLDEDRRQSRASLLTQREVQIVQYIARGLSKKEIAATMHLAVKTVDRHCANLMTKLDIHDRVGLTRFAIREGLAGVDA